MAVTKGALGGFVGLGVGGACVVGIGVGVTVGEGVAVTVGTRVGTGVGVGRSGSRLITSRRGSLATA